MAGFRALFSLCFFFDEQKFLNLMESNKSIILWLSFGSLEIPLIPGDYEDISLFLSFRTFHSTASYIQVFNFLGNNYM